MGASEVPGPVRAFVAIELPPSSREPLAAYLDACRAREPHFRWVPPENLHLTLRFLGAVDPPRLAAVSGRLRQVEVVPFELGLGGVGRFGGRQGARVVWLGVGSGLHELRGLAAAVEAACLSAGIPGLDREFNPHVTLARARAAKGGPLADLPAPPGLPPWRVEEIALMRSRLLRSGAVYEPLVRAGRPRGALESDPEPREWADGPEGRIRVADARHPEPPD